MPGAKPGLPSTETIRSPAKSTPAAGLSFSTRSTIGATCCIGREANSTQRMRNASTMFTAGPAAMTTIRFQTGWRK